ncbi:MAG: uracil-DNA glycosylase [Verrucomicrobiae bacterium]|nr:uracil-DNA glycosylase [Verrucomicrobiae bacterium]
MDYPELLEATIRHLEEEKARGVRHVNVDREVLSRLARPISRSIARSDASPSVPETAPRPQSPRIEVPGQSAPVSESRRVEKFEPTRVTRSREEKETAMAGLRERAMGCALCPNLAAARTQVVFGVGNIHTELMFVGEAPGMDEDRQGEPFVGKAGELLNKIIGAMGLKREEIYIGNVVKCRPDTPGQASGNRPPTPVEMAACLPFLAAQIDIIQPKVIVCLGTSAVQGLLGKKQIGITRLRGKWMSFEGIPVMPTYHPAYLLRNQSVSEKRKVWEDMLAAMERLGLPISEKQRGYFLQK